MKAMGQSIKGACEALGVSRSGYYRRRGPRGCSVDSEGELLSRIREICAAHPFWGYRRVTAWLRHREGHLINHKKVYRLMKESGLTVKSKRYRACRTPQRSKPRAVRPNQYWGIDMTKFMIPSLGWCYLIVVLDWFTKKVVGWDVCLRARSREWFGALERAVSEGFPEGVRGRGLKLVSDNGSQPTSRSFMTGAATLGIEQIFCSYDNPKGNAETERFMRTIKEELIWLAEFGGFEEAKERIGTWIEDDYNKLYVHSVLGYLSPEEFTSLWREEEARRACVGVA